MEPEIPRGRAGTGERVPSARESRAAAEPPVRWSTWASCGTTTSAPRSATQQCPALPHYRRASAQDRRNWTNEREKEKHRNLRLSFRRPELLVEGPLRCLGSVCVCEICAAVAAKGDAGVRAVSQEARVMVSVCRGDTC